MENVIIFGRGRYFHKKYNREAYKIAAFLDNGVKEKEYSREYGCNVYPPADWKQLPKYPIVCMSARFCEMWKQLVELGVPERRIVPGVELEPFYYDHERILFSRGGCIQVTRDALSYVSPGREAMPFSSEEEFQKIVREIVKETHAEIGAFDCFQVRPLSRTFGNERGKAVDRVYIERFLEENAGDIRGSVMEIESDDYIKRFGGSQVSEEWILHVKGWGGKNVIKGNFETGEGLRENMVDCLICTQTLQYIFDLQSAVRHIYETLRPGGTGLITVPGIKGLSQFHDENWGEQWSFTERSAARLFAGAFGEEQVEVRSWGNVRVAMAFLYGLCREELREEDFAYDDKQFPFLITVRAVKRKE